MLTRTLFAAAALLLAGCATQDEYTSLKKDFFKDANGHVIGERETLRNARTGDTIERVEVFVVLLDSDGRLIGYEQRVKDGSVVRDVKGEPIGARYSDLRSRGNNPGSGGMLLLMQ